MTNTTDATRGQSLRVRVEARKLELEGQLATLAEGDASHTEVAHALGELGGLLTGDLDQIPRIVAADLNKWLEAHKHVNERHPAGSASDGDAAAEPSDVEPAIAGGDVAVEN